MFFKKLINFKKIISSFLLVIILLLIILILIKSNILNKDKVKKIFYENYINLGRINKLSNKIIGKDLLYYDNAAKVSSIEVFEIKNKEKYLNGQVYNLKSNNIIGSLESGIIIYNGFKDDYNHVIIVQTTDGYNFWYGNLSNPITDLFTYIEKGSVIGEPTDKKIYLVIEKDNKYFTYEEYKQNKN